MWPTRNDKYVTIIFLQIMITNLMKQLDHNL